MSLAPNMEPAQPQPTHKRPNYLQPVPETPEESTGPLPVVSDTTTTDVATTEASEVATTADTTPQAATTSEIAEAHPYEGVARVIYERGPRFLRERPPSFVECVQYAKTGDWTNSDKPAVRNVSKSVVYVLGFPLKLVGSLMLLPATWGGILLTFIFVITVITTI